jgi:hypothetical protein
MVSVLEDIEAQSGNDSPLSPPRKLQQRLIAGGLNLAKAVKSHLPGSHNRPDFQRHRYPKVPLAEVRAKLDRFIELLGDRGPAVRLHVEALNDVMFQIQPETDEA